MPENLPHAGEYTFEELEWVAERLHGEGLTRSLAEASPELLWQCARSVQPNLRAAVAKLRTLPADIARHLAADPAARVRKAIAGNRAVSTDVLRMAAENHTRDMIPVLADNPHTPSEVLEGLRDCDWSYLVARNPNTPPR